MKPSTSKKKTLKIKAYAVIDRESGYIFSSNHGFYIHGTKEEAIRAYNRINEIIRPCEITLL